MPSERRSPRRSGNYKPLYFRNAPSGNSMAGKDVIVVKASASGTITMNGVRDGDYNLTRSNASENHVTVETVTASRRVMSFTGASGSTYSLVQETNVAVAVEGEATPGALALRVGYPNPFRATAHLTFEVAEAGLVRLVVYDALGRAVATLVDRDLSAGRHAVRWDAAGLAAGLYVARLEAAGATAAVSLTHLNRPCIVRCSRLARREKRPCHRAEPAAHGRPLRPAGFTSPAYDHIDGMLDLHENLAQNPTAIHFARVEGARWSTRGSSTATSSSTGLCSR